MKISIRFLQLKLILIIFLLVFFSLRVTECQTSDSPIETDTTKYLLGGAIGLNDFHIKDEYLSPYPFGGIMFSSKLLFEAESESGKHALETYFSTGKIDSDEQPRNVTPTIVSLSYSYTHVIDNWEIAERSFKFSLGAGISSFVMNTDFVTESQAGVGEYYDQSWYWSHSLNFLAGGDYALSENKILSAQLVLPFFRIVSRPYNGHWNNPKNSEIISDNFLNAALDGRREFFWDNFVLYCAVEYKQKLKENIYLHGGYRFNFVSSGSPLPMNSYMNNFLIGFDFSL
ncbi:MAG: hypothetical protein AB1521_07510 [Bacteroidota bacterium]